MLDKMLELILIGACGYGLAVMLDDAMRPGKILGFIRTALSGTKWELKDIWEDDDLTYEAAEEKYTELLWDIAREKKWLVLFLCRVCISAWTTLALVVAYSPIEEILYSIPIAFAGTYLTSIFDR